MKSKEIAELLTRIEEAKDIDFNSMGQEEFNKWVRLIENGKDTS